eukprot:GFYU01003031.1.p1 GENE.GFYU01003031.1~~GFYU01003031.1.p1  ORF type:complete len:331 (-),score=74.34 GFYU01003031.1:157-1041(-)
MATKTTYARDKFISAAKDNNIKEARQLLKTNPEVIHEKDKSGETALHKAAHWGNLDMLKLLVVHGKGDYNVPDTRGQTPLHASGDLKVTKYLCEIGATVEAKDQNAVTPLHVACKHDKLSIVKYLVVEHAADPLSKDSRGMTPLHYASAEGHMELIKFLCEEECVDHTVEAEDGSTPAAVAKSTELKRYLETKEVTRRSLRRISTVSSGSKRLLEKYGRDSKVAGLQVADEDLLDWLANLGMPRYYDSFFKEAYSYAVLRDFGSQINDQTLQDIGVDNADDRVKLLDAIKQFGG